MAELQWESYKTITTSAVDVDFDFENYAYRARRGNSSRNIELFKGQADTYYRVVFLTDSNDPARLYLGTGDFAGGILTSGINRLLLGTFNTHVEIERALLWSPPNFQPKIGGTIRETEMAWVKVDGQLREVDKVWTKVNGVLREV